MYKYLSIIPVILTTNAFAADVPRVVPNPRPIVEYVTPATPSIVEYSLSTGGMYSLRDRVMYATAKPRVSYNNFGIFGEYGYSRNDKQFVSGGLDYRHQLPYNVDLTPSAKMGYHWNRGAFVSPGIQIGKDLTEQLSIYARYDYIQYRRESDNQFGIGLNIKF